MCVEHPLICVHNIIEAPLHSPAWMTHVAAVVVHRCVTQALEQSIDPRTHLNDINWGPMSETWWVCMLIQTLSCSGLAAKDYVHWKFVQLPSFLHIWLLYSCCMVCKCFFFVLANTLLLCHVVHIRQFFIAMPSCISTSSWLTNRQVMQRWKPFFRQ